MKCWITLSLVFCASLCAAHDSLRLAHVVFRHGDRAASQTFPGMPDQEALWPDGFSQLTQVGAEQARGLGSWLHARYGGFINTTSRVNQQVRVRSSDTDRTLMSASAVLLGLFPSHPIPVHTRPSSMDYELSSDAECPAFAALQEDYLRELSQEIFSRLPDKMYADTIAQNTAREQVDIVDMLAMADTLYCLRRHPELGLSVGEWMDAGLEEWLYTLRERAGRLYDSSLTATYLTTGPLWGLVHDAYRTVVNNQQTNKLYLYASHDLLLSGLLSSLGVWDGRTPPYAAAVLLELHEHPAGHFSVRLYYRNSSHVTAPPIPLVLPGCPFDCPLQEFVEQTAAYTFTGSLGEWREICGVHSDTHGNLVALAITLAVCLLFCVAWIVKLKVFSAHRPGYQSLA